MKRELIIIEKKISAIEYIRGVSMLGVIGIHTGSQYLSNPMANIHLVAAFEIATRFSVPIFFFISAFGLFYRLDAEKPFDYRLFLARRLKSVLIPYLVWSLIYLIHYTLVYRDFSFWSLPMLSQAFFFGLASYQLYFLVILLWFYALMPVWIWLVRRMTAIRLGALFALQIAFDYYSSYVLSPNFASDLPNLLVAYRLNYWVFHYLFIFILGAYAASRKEAFYAWLKRRQGVARYFFFLSFAGLLGYYYKLIYVGRYSAEAAVNTAHQLSPAGILYTVGACIFFFSVFSFAKFPPAAHRLLAAFGRHSYFAYLFHPFAIHYLFQFVSARGLIMTAPIAIVFYVAVVAVSMGAAVFMRRAGDRFYRINQLLIGVSSKK